MQSYATHHARSRQSDSAHECISLLSDGDSIINSGRPLRMSVQPAHRMAKDV